MIMQLLQLVVMGDFIYHYVQWYVVNIEIYARFLVFEKVSRHNSSSLLLRVCKQTIDLGQA